MGEGDDQKMNLIDILSAMNLQSHGALQENMSGTSLAQQMNQ